MAEASTTGRAWTPGEDEILKLLIPKNTPGAEISKLIDRSERSIATRARTLHLARPLGSRPYLEKELGFIRSAFAKGMTDEQIGDELGRTASSVADKRQRLGLRRSTFWARFGRAVDRPAQRPSQTASHGRHACTLHLIDLMREYGGKDATVANAKAEYRKRCEYANEPSSYTPPYVHVSMFNGSACGSPAQMCVA